MNMIFSLLESFKRKKRPTSKSIDTVSDNAGSSALTKKIKCSVALNAVQDSIERVIMDEIHRDC